MKLTFNIKVYHGTEYSNIRGICENGFKKSSISCATQNKNWAKGYGNSLISFKYPFELYFSFKTIEEDLEYLKRFIIDYLNKSLPVGVAGFKPKNLKINNK